MTFMNDTLTIFHRADLDGLACEAIARKALGSRSDYLGFDYGDTVPDLTPYSTVYLLDISLPLPVMAEHAAKLIVVDHHRTLLDAVQPIVQRGGFKGFYGIEGVAACRLAQQWFNTTDAQRAAGVLPSKDAYTSIPSRVTEPRAIELLGRYDIWDRRLPDVDFFQLGMQAEKEPLWDRLLAIFDEDDIDGCDYQRGYVEQILRAGRAIQSYTDTTNAKIVTERGFDVTWEGLRFRALCTARSTSLTFTAALTPDHDGCLSYFWDGGKWRFSLYHAPGQEHQDMGAIAKRHGGGGHKGAAGGFFRTLPVELGGPATWSN